MQRDEVHERAAVARQCRQLRRMLRLVVDSTEHHILERHATIERPQQPR
jgi:hypothetical protein